MSDPTELPRFGSMHGSVRSEDAPLLTGRGRFTDDIVMPGAAHAAFVRSPVASGRIEAVDTQAAATMPGVRVVLTGRDLEADGIGAIPPVATTNSRDGQPMFAAPMPVLARNYVRYVGEPVAIVVAETLREAMDAAEAVIVSIESQAAVGDVESALAEGAPAVWQDAPGNVALDWEDGDDAAVDQAFAAATHVERVRLVDTRLAPTAMEPRAAIASFEPASGRYTLIASTQGVAIVRKVLAESVFKVPPQQVRVLTYDVGGGFGMKAQAYVEYAAVMYAAQRIARPVRWVASRLESFLGDTHGRDGLLEGELALDSSGRFLGLRMRTSVGIGAYTTTFAAIFTTANTKNCASSVYVIPAIHVAARAVLTNAAPLGPYRGAGRPEAIYIVE